MAYESLNDAMVANDELAEAEMRYRLLSEAFTDMPQLRSQLNTQIERAKAEILRLRALAPAADDSTAAAEDKTGKVVAFDANRYRRPS